MASGAEPEAAQAGVVGLLPGRVLKHTKHVPMDARPVLDDKGLRENPTTQMGYLSCR